MQSKGLSRVFSNTTVLTILWASRRKEELESEEVTYLRLIKESTVEWKDLMLKSHPSRGNCPSSTQPVP